MENNNQIVYSNLAPGDPLYSSTGLNTHLNFNQWLDNKDTTSIYIYRIASDLSLLEVAVDVIRNTHNLFMLYDSCLEGYTTVEFERLHEYSVKHQLKDKFIFLSGNRDAEEEYNLWLKDNQFDKLFKVCYNSNWYYRVKQNTIDYNLKKRTINKTEWFMCLNNRLHNHRAVAITYMDYLGMLEKGKISCLDKTYELHIANPASFSQVVFDYSHEFSEEIFQTLENQVSLTAQKLPLNLDTENFLFGSRPHDFNKAFYNKALINLVTETYYYECFNNYSHMFLSEKIWKPIVSKQMFVLIGPRYALQYLRELGFKTFDDFIDESYDTMDTDKRIFAAINALDHAMKTYTIEELNNKTKETRAYNFKHFMSQRIQQILCPDIKKQLCT